MIPAIAAIATVGVSLRVWLTANADALLGAMGKDASLTGRADLWPLVWDAIWRRPWLGYGFSGYWLGLKGESASLLYAVGWNAPNAHSGILDLLLDVGFVGLSIYAIGFLTTVLKGLVWVRLSKASEGLWPVVYLTYIVLANLAESTLLIQNNIFWVLYVAVAFSVLLPPERPDKAIA